MEKVYVYRHVVRSDEIDTQGHVNNTCYVGWMQDAAISHSALIGWNDDRYREIGSTWVAREHRVEYLHPTYLGDTILIQTWVATMQRVRSVRRYRMLRESDGVVVSQAETLWAFVDIETGRPTRIADEIIAAFHAASIHPEDAA
jgi:Predicted thioesterase